MMLWRRKIVVEPDDIFSKGLVDDLRVDQVLISDYLRFVFFCALLLIPVYAIIKSAINHNWLMMVVDALLVPVGFVHGVLMLTGVLN